VGALLLAIVLVLVPAEAIAHRAGGALYISDDQGVRI
jgi:hypothetical protein